MSETYFDGATIDRIDNNQGYFKENCRWTDSLRQARNKRKSKANTSGCTGVHWDVKDGRTYARGCFKEDGKLKSKSFSVQKYGLLEAFAMAVEYRKKQIERLNELGYGYTPTHGL